MIGTIDKTLLDDTNMAERRLKREKKKYDSRSPWEIDLSRLIHSASYRRLQSKTQVLGLGESDFYRTRLTHSMEVAQIAIGIVKHLKEQKTDDISQDNLLPDANLIMGIGLAHDLGHPPFGHGGEIALNYCMREYGGFEGNAQTLRIISKLEKYDEHFGINPTRRMMLGVLKYPVTYQNAVNESIYEKVDNIPKWLFKSKSQKPPKCIYDEDQDVFNFILEIFSANDVAKFKSLVTSEEKHKKTKYKSFDTSIMELADDIAYGIHDLEDAISLHMITEKDWREYFDGAYKEDKWPSGLSIKYDNSAKKNFVDNAKEEDVFDYNFESLTNNLFGDSYKRKKAIGNLVHAMIVNIELQDINISEEIKYEHPLLRFNARMNCKYKLLLSTLQSLVVQKVIEHPNVQMLEFKGQKIIVELFNALSCDPERFLPDFHKQEWQIAIDQKEKNRIICDYIAGMTDDYAVRQYEKLLVPNRGSIFEFL